MLFTLHVKWVAACWFYQFHQLWTIRQVLSTDNARVLVYAVISTCIDYCNSVLHRVVDVHLHPFQSVLNAAMCLIVQTLNSDSITASLWNDLHWLLVPQWVHFGMTFTGCLSPSEFTTNSVYLSTMCQPVSENLSRCCLRLAARGDLAVPATRTVRYGLRSFAVVGPSTWNPLPMSLHDQSLTLTSFCRQLKTFLFSRAYASSAWSWLLFHC